MKFSKEKMIERITAEGREDMLTPDVISIMDNLDGQEALAQCWQRVVMDEPVFYVIGKDGNGEYVNENDCL